MKRSLYYLYIVLFALLGLSKEVSAQIDTDRVMIIGQNAISFKDYVLAIQYFNTAIRYSPEKAEPYYFRGVAKYSLGDLYGAESDCSACLERNPYIYRAYFLRALARQTLGKDSLALSDYKVVLSNNPDEQGALHNISLLYIEQKDTVSAQHALDRLKRFYPRYAPSYLIEGSLALSHQDTITATQLFRQGLNLDPTSPAPYQALARVAYAQKEYRRALEHLDLALTYDAEATDLYVFRGIVRFQLNNLKGAMADYTTAIELKPGNLLARYNRALLRTRVGELQGAVNDFNILLGYDPGNILARYNRALLSADLGNYKQASQDLDIIIDRYPTFVPAYLHRASARRYLGDGRGADIDIYHASQLLNDPKARKLFQKRGSKKVKDLDDDPETKDTRGEEDKNIHKFRMLIHDTGRHGYDELYQEEESIRGQIQDRKGRIEPEPMYILSYYEGENKVRIETNEYKNRWGNPKTAYALRFVRQLPFLSESVIAEHQKRLDGDLKEENEVELFGRAMDFITLKDYQGAASCLSRVIDMDTSDIVPLARFQYASVLMYLYALEAKKGMGGDSGIEVQSSPLLTKEGAKNTTSLVISSHLKQLSSKAIQQLQRLSESHPEDALIFYNLGCIYYTVGVYSEAIEYFTKAIAIDKDLSASYFNRALCHYAMGNAEMGYKDMSVAGGLGLYKAYSIIKRVQ